MTRPGTLACAASTVVECTEAVEASVDMPNAPWAVYLIECADGRVYTGIARDPEQRYAKHLSGKGARFTRSNPPRQLLGWVWVASHGDALRLEIAWKRLPRAARIAALRSLAPS